MKLNKEELLIGFILGITFWFKIGWLAVPLACLTSFLWAYSGAGANKLFRRLGVPLACAGSVAVVHHALLPLISIPLAFGVLSLGYGIPDSTDKGSWLGQLCLVYAGGDEKKANLYCRGVLYTLLALAFLPCWII